MKKILISTMVAFLILGGANFNASSASISLNPGNDEFSGEELFYGLFFGQGEVAKLIPELNEKEVYNTNNSDEAISLSKETLESVLEKNPDYLNELEKAVYSKDPNKIKSVFLEGGKLITESLEDNEYIEPGEDGQGLYVVAGVTVVVVALAAIVAGGAVYLSVVTWNTAGTNGTNPISSQKADIYVDKYVADIVSNL